MINIKNHIKSAAFLLLMGGSMLSTAQEKSPKSTCYGTTSHGHIEHAVQLPSHGKNFKGYSLIARSAGRTYVHSSVQKIILDTYKKLETEQAKKVYKYAETGKKEGGIFKPHKTHQNGLSVDFMVPVINLKGKSVHLPTNPSNKFGYNIEFNTDDSRYKNYRIDYEAMAAHIALLHQTAVSQGYDLWRVIFDPDLQPHLFSTTYGDYLKSNIQFSTRRSWVRHDEHYHIDFSIPCL